MPKVIKPEDDIKRLEILNKILDILGKKEGMSDPSGLRQSASGDSEITFFLSKMDLDEVAQKKIYELEPEIKKYYVCGKWSCFNIAKETKRKWLSIIKYICKDHGKTLETGNVKYSDGTYDTVYKIVY
jgi:hypothetical protein